VGLTVEDKIEARQATKYLDGIVKEHLAQMAESKLVLKKMITEN